MITFLTFPFITSISQKTGQSDPSYSHSILIHRFFFRCIKNYEKANKQTYKYVFGP